MASDPLADHPLVRRQAALQAEAARLVAELELTSVLRPLGPPLQLGSSVMGLMVWRDLDFVVRAPGLPADAMFRAVLPILVRPGLVSADYRNEHGGNIPGGDPRYARHYLVLRYRASTARVWKIDLTFWTGTHHHDHEGYTRQVVDRLDDASRLAILRLKDRWRRLSCYPEVVGGHEVYDAVLNHGVRTPGEFVAYLRARGLECG